MMKNMTLENIAAACGGQIYYMREDLAQETAKGVVIDSRQIEPAIFLWQQKVNAWMAIVLFPTYLQRVRWQLSVKYCRKRTWDRVSLWKTVLWL